MMKNIFKFDEVTGYRYGFFMWLIFFVPSLVVLLADTTQGDDRLALTYGTLFSTLGYVIYAFYFFEGRPASTPSQIAILGESAARWVIYAHFGLENVLNGSPVGVMNWILVIISGLFFLMKASVQVYLNFNHQAYLDYENDLILKVEKKNDENNNL